MTNEEIQKVMEFVIKQQETFAEGMEQMRLQTDERLNTLERAAVNLYNVAADLGSAHKDLVEKVSVLADKISELAEAQAHTDQRVNALIDILDQRRNGETPT